MPEKNAFIDEPDIKKPILDENDESEINQQITDENEQLYRDADILLLKRPRMAKKEFIKKIDLYMIGIRKKFMQLPDTLKNQNRFARIEATLEILRDELLKKRKIENSFIVKILGNL